MSDTVGTVLLTREQIEERAREIGEEIARDYEGEEVYLIGTLRGAVVWMADMMKNIKNDMEIDFVMASSYGSSTTSSGVVEIKKDLEGDIYGKNVIIVEDIVDTGTTLKFLKEHLADRNPKSIKICTLLDKPERRVVDVSADYVGFSIDNLFVVGYGLDYDQKYRNLPYISYLEG
ncbi:MAG: hypoxanthine phosphoribosyltransferase [Firmicutes bacterium]|nr:hypoxanthine phosphoribosyltransferase [Bacillota bacterium]